MSRLSDSSNGLILRVHRRDGPSDEIYVEPGLTIGRSVANTVILAGDTSVDQQHARAEVSHDGTLCLCCQDPASTILQNGEKVSKVALEPGQQFKIGDTDFECLRATRTDKSVYENLGSSSRGCPYCQSESVPLAGSVPRCCPNCGEEVLAVENVSDNAEVQLVPVTYGSFRAERFVARGGMGVVLKGITQPATTSAHGEPSAVAIKLLPATCQDTASQERFQREVALLSQVQHPNVVRLLGSGVEAGYSFLVMEWIEGETLKDKFTATRAEDKHVDFGEALPWFIQVCDGLNALHKAGIVHRDLKPSNILVGTDKVARIVDLGIAKSFGNDDHSLTTTGSAPGTFVYMAPEQHRAPETVDARADIYALGVTFLELLTGQLAIGVCKPASVVNSTVPQLFSDLLLQMMSQGADDRPSTVSDIVSCLEARFPEASSASRKSETLDTGNVPACNSDVGTTGTAAGTCQQELVGAAFGATIGLCAAIFLYFTVAPWVGYVVGVPAVIAAAIRGSILWIEPDFRKRHFIDLPDEDVHAELLSLAQQCLDSRPLQLVLFGDPSEVPLRRFLKDHRLWLMDRITVLGEVSNVMIGVGLGMVMLRNYLLFPDLLRSLNSLLGWILVAVGLHLWSLRKTYPNSSGLLLLPFMPFSPDRSAQRLRILDALLPLSDLNESPPSRLPKYFYWSAFAPLCLPLAPMAFWLSTSHQSPNSDDSENDDPRTNRIAAAARLWTLFWSLQFICYFFGLLFSIV
jgi:serine/threonine protein kinase